jgi:hypothetical protein
MSFAFAAFQLLVQKHFNFLANLRKLKNREFLQGELQHFNFTAYGIFGHVTSFDM